MSLIARLSLASKPFAIAARSMATLSPKQVPAPMGKISTPEEFLTVIGRDCKKYASKFPDWASLFTSKGESMKELGIPVKQRRWILNWTNKMRLGIEPYYIKPSTKNSKKKK
ncbi:Protein FYV4, mitochondrial [Smittium culicis]|uniref:Small ribosomal subunit protein mS41 n=1 Tax=Smittium culicis TaxID=133412 RepID=A0A1R1XXM9_9FUNG|nr:Protein FYV4, mitochondrial [Smittium culicis]